MTLPPPPAYHESNLTRPALHTPTKTEPRLTTITTVTSTSTAVTQDTGLPYIQLRLLEYLQLKLLRSSSYFKGSMNSWGRISLNLFYGEWYTEFIDFMEMS